LSIGIKRKREKGRRSGTRGIEGRGQGRVREGRRYGNSVDQEGG